MIAAAVLLNVCRAPGAGLDAILELPAREELRMGSKTVFVLGARKARVLLDMTMGADEDQTGWTTDDSSCASGSVYDCAVWCRAVMELVRVRVDMGAR